MMRYLTAHEIASIYRRPVGTVYRLASEGGWKRVPDKRRPVLYDSEDVDLTFSRLAAQRLDVRPAAKDDSINIDSVSV